MYDENKVFKDMILKDKKQIKIFSILLIAFDTILLLGFMATKQLSLSFIPVLFNIYIIYLIKKTSSMIKAINEKKYIVLEETVVHCYIKNYDRYDRSHPPFYYLITKDKDGFYHCRKYNLYRFNSTPKKNEVIKVLVFNKDINADKMNKIKLDKDTSSEKEFKKQFKKRYNRNHKMLYIPYCYNETRLNKDNNIDDDEEDYY